MTTNFCHLPKDKKTFNILKKYIEDIQNHIDLLKEDNELQIQEMIEHKNKTGENGNTWINKYAKNMRVYLNTIKELAIIFIATERELTWDNYIYFCDKLNMIHDEILEKIF
jgi:hypothetical protein